MVICKVQIPLKGKERKVKEIKVKDLPLLRQSHVRQVPAPPSLSFEIGSTLQQLTAHWNC